jgi:PAS domain S-box-containing protein
MANPSERKHTDAAISEWNQAMDAIPDVIAILDTQRRIRYANLAHANRTGLTPEECVGLACCATFHGSASTATECPHAQMLATHNEHTAEVHDARTGSDYLVTVSPLFDEHDQLTGSVHIARDITSLKRNEAALQQTVALLRATLDATTDGIVVVDRQGRIVDYNRQFAQLWRIPQEILDQHDDAQALAYVQKQLKYPEEFMASTRNLYAHPAESCCDLVEFLDGRVFERSSRPQLVQDEPIGRVWCFRDITDRRKAESALYRQMSFDAIATQFLARSARSTPADLDALIQTSIEELGFFADVDETYIALHDLNTWSARFAWHAPHMAGLIEHYQNCLHINSPWMTTILQSGQIVQLQTLDDLPPEAAEEHKRLARDGVVSLLLLPLRGKGNLVQGSLGLRTYTKPIAWATEDVLRIRLLGDAIVSVLERRQAESAQYESETRLRAILEAVQTGILMVDAETRCIVDVNTAAAQLIGAPKEAILGQPDHQYLTLTLSANATPAVPAEDVLQTADGRQIPVLKTVIPIRIKDRNHLLATVADIRALKQMEEQILHVQKMDAIGRLAGGIAHDFNNLIQVILGFSDITLMDLLPEHPHHQDLQEIRTAALRAGEITGQLLAFSRRQTVMPTVLNLNTIVTETVKMLQSILGEDVQLITQFGTDLHRIYADAGQLSQVVMNLAVNARDAMPQGGRLTISTSAVTLSPQDTAQLQYPDATPGDFICLTMTDTGCGIPENIRAHLFEPFFTTKGPGKGTGLGLSVVYGIVKQYHGWIQVDSRLGAGATFRLYFPVYAGNRTGDNLADEAEGHALDPALRGHGERILLVEDEANVGCITVQMLEAANYEAVVCATAQEALTLFHQAEPKFALLFSDVVLPDRTGVVLADELRTYQPNLPVLLCSGYTDERARLNTIIERGYLFLQKPYSLTELLRIIRRLLATQAQS